MQHDPSQPPLIPETLLKRRRNLEELALRRVEHIKSQGKKRRIVRGENVHIKRPEQYVREFRIRQGSQNKMNRRKRATERRTTIAIPQSAVKDTVGFAIRIHRGRHTSPEIKEELNKLGLTHKYNGIFVNLNQETVARLKPLDSYVAYGFLSAQLVHDLIHRRAYIQHDGVRTHLSDNMVLENILGDKNILCLNDLAHEVFTIGPAFADCLSILVPFQLSAPVGGYERKILQIHDEVESKGGFLTESELEIFLRKIL